MNTILEKRKISLEKEKAKLILKEKLLTEQTKKKRAKFFQEIGRIAYKAGIDELGPEILLGAFLEISENKTQLENTKKWQLKAQTFNENRYLNEVVPLVIKISKNLSPELISELKKLKFRWNPITKDYYGKGNVQFLDNLLKGLDFKIIEIPS
jgi:hypothetical protein